VVEIVLENVAKRFGSVSVIEDLNLTMHDNEFTVLVGPSGCGKSTTLRMIAGLEDVSDGEIYIDGKPVSHLEPKERDIAMVFQDYALYPHMNVARNMSFALRLAHYDRAEIRRRVEQVADMLGIRELLGRKPRELSGGQRQRVAMGRALVRDASTFLFDEPLSNLDAKLRTQMRAELALMRQRIRKNMVYVTHDQIEAMTLGDRIVVMQKGRIMQAGTPEELFKRPQNKFVAGFIGSPSMNFFDAELGSTDGPLTVTGDGFSLALPLDAAARLKSHRGRAVTIGIRPTAFQVVSDGQPAGNVIRAPVVVSEYIGSNSIVMSEIGRTRVTIDIGSDQPIAVGQTVQVRVAAEAIYVFDPGTDRVL
jgi:multiple sugar transport system ATP-binding protein